MQSHCGIGTLARSRNRCFVGAIASLRLAKMNASVCSVTGFLIMFPGDDQHGLALVNGTGMS